MSVQYSQQLNASWTISTHFATQIRKLLLRFQTKNDNLVETVKIPLKTSHGIFTLRLPTPSINKYEYWKRHTKKY